MHDLTLFLCGDVMPGRGIDQVLPRSCPPRLHEPFVSSARDYVALAERAHGPIPRPVRYDYPWGEALAELERARPQARIVNLETAVTTSEDAERKPVLYRMHPGNAPLLTAARIDCCALANNHAGDWGTAGLVETLDALARVGVGIAGAGRDLEGAARPCVLPLADARVLVFGFGSVDAGVPPHWAAAPGWPGVHLLPGFSARAVRQMAELVGRWRAPGDVVVASIHWGPNWGYEVPASHRAFAHALLDDAGVDLVHGHSSHHPKALELHHGRLVLYGCGDFLDDYEGIHGHEAYRGDLGLMYFPTLDAGGRLRALRMVPLQTRRFRLAHPARADRDWLRGRLARELRPFGLGVRAEGDAYVLA